ncbi:MAG: hypothetical protein ACKVOW_21280 [Chitinophagaceae bacterium]
MMKKWVAPALLALFLNSCKTKDLQYLSFDHFKVEKLGFPNSVISLDVTCYNPNKFGLQLLKLETAVSINKEFLGNAFLDSALTIPRKDTFLIPIKMEVKMGGAMTGLLKLMNNSGDSTLMLINLEGTSRIKKGAISINYPIKYEEMKVLKF